MATILITGGTGLVGKSLTAMLLEKNHEVIFLSRKKTIANHERQRNKIRTAGWDIEKQTIDAQAVGSADYIIHLAGANVAQKRWTKNRKDEILKSRVAGSALILKALRDIPNKVSAVISASAIGWYGPDAIIPPQKYFTETDKSYHDFLGETCRLWEDSIDPVSTLNKRLVKIRTGIVLAGNGGALTKFIRPLKFNIAAILAGGEQIISWIHIDDLCRIYLEAIENTSLGGVFNAVAPDPVSNKTLTLELARALKKKQFIPVHVPAFLLKIILGEMSIEVLKSCAVSADKIKRTGFQFVYPGIESALKNLTAPANAFE